MMQSGAFPFKIEDLVSWTVRRTDGSVTQFSLTTVEVSKSTTEASHAASYSHIKKESLSAYCCHVPKDPSFDIAADVRPGVAAPLSLYVGGISSKQVKDQFDFIVDGGDIFNAWDVGSKILEGDAELVSLLDKHVVQSSGPRILKIDWTDRQAPALEPAFWPQLNEQLYGDVLVCCQGGHGRSGTSFVCLLLCNAPDYDALDAIIHLRAIHCPRAIESVVQHEYINRVAEYLGRKPNAFELADVHDYKTAFDKISKPTAELTRKALKIGD